MTGRRFTPRPAAHELSADSRRVVAAIIDAHDNPDVSVEDYAELLRTLPTYVVGLPDAERLEVCLQVHQHAVRAISGNPSMTAVGIVDS